MAYRVVQLSDIHLSDRDSDHRIEPKIRGQLKGMNVRFRSLLRSDLVSSADLILITGDVTDTGNIEAWTNFWTSIKSSGLADKTHLIVGNHDVAYMGLLRFVIPRSTRSIARARYFRGLKLGNAPRAYPWFRLFNDERLLVAALRSTVEDNFTSLHNALGVIPRTQLNKLRKILKDHHHVPNKIVTLHHPPIFPKDGSVDGFLHDVPESQGMELIALCQKYGVELVMHGHMHLYMDQKLGDVRIIGCPASTEPLYSGSEDVEVIVVDYEDDFKKLSRVTVTCTPLEPDLKRVE